MHFITGADDINTSSTDDKTLGFEPGPGGGLYVIWIFLMKMSGYADTFMGEQRRTR